MNYNFLIGIEWEFYIIDDYSIEIDKILIDNFLDDLKNTLGIFDNIGIERENGKYQFEINMRPYKDMDLLCKDFHNIKKITSKIIKKHNFISNFKSQPFRFDCGSALQINFNIINEDGRNKFINHDIENSLLLYSVAGILKYCNKFLEFYINDKEDLLRFDYEVNKELYKNGKYASPINLSWGYNNRTTAIRIAGRDQNRRIEFRVPSSNSDLSKILKYFLKSIDNGINKRIIPEEEIYGNAMDYDRKRIL